MQTPASPDFLQATEFVDYANSPDDFFSILDALDTELLNHENNDVSRPNQGTMVESQENRGVKTLISQNSTSSVISADTEPEVPAAAAAAALATSTNNSNEMSSPKSNKRKLSNPEPEDGQQKISHITVERNRRKQMNENLTVLRSLMPSFYVKRGDQASIVGGVADYISELQQILRSLEAKKQRKLMYSEVMSPRLLTSPRTTMSLPISPRKPPLSPRLISSLPASPRTPQGSQPIISNNNSCNFPNLNMSRLMHQTAAAEATTANNFLLSPTSSCSTSSNIDNDQLVANSKSPVADVEVKFSGPNLILNVVSRRLPGQALKIILALEHLSLEILNVSLNTTEQTMIQSFTIKIGIECQLSAEELAHQIQQTFCS